MIILRSKFLFCLYQKYFQEYPKENGCTGLSKYASNWHISSSTLKIAPAICNFDGCQSPCLHIAWQPWVHHNVFTFYTLLFFASCSCSLKRSTGSFICIASRMPPFSLICSVRAFDRFSALFLFFKADFDKLAESNKWNKFG